MTKKVNLFANLKSDFALGLVAFIVSGYSVLTSLWPVVCHHWLVLFRIWLVVLLLAI